jgi:hypothetical protein
MSANNVPGPESVRSLPHSRPGPLTIVGEKIVILEVTPTVRQLARVARAIHADAESKGSAA